MNPKIAIKVVIGIMVATALFHLSIIFKIVPYDIAWGGRLTNDEEMYTFEGISIAINLFLIFVLLMKGGHIKAVIPMKIVNIILWIFLGLFVMNTVANLFAETQFEKYFSIVTALLAWLIFVILIRGKKIIGRTTNADNLI